MTTTARYPGEFDAPVIMAAPGTAEVVPAVANKRIVLTGYHGTITQVGSIQWKSGSTAKGGPMDVDAKSGFVVYPSRGAILATARGEALNLTTLGGGFNGTVSYRLED